MSKQEEIAHYRQMADLWRAEAERYEQLGRSKELVEVLNDWQVSTPKGLAWLAKELAAWWTSHPHD